MKTQFSRRRNVYITPGRLLVGVGTILLLVALSITTHFFPTLFLSLARPGFLLGASLSESTRTLSSFFEDKDALLSRIDALTVENQALQNENRTLRGKFSDITGLRDADSLSIQGIPAGVLVRPPLSPYDTLVIELPSGERAREGALVFATGGVPVGTITKGGTVAQVELFSAPSRLTYGWVGEKRLPVSLVGESAGAFTATLPREAIVAVNDIVYLPGPGAIAVGSVSHIDSDPSSTSQTLYIVPYVNIFSLTWVVVAP